jgi:hypothetical protein
MLLMNSFHMNKITYKTTETTQNNTKQQFIHKTTDSISGMTYLNH